MYYDMQMHGWMPGQAPNTTPMTPDEWKTWVTTPYTPPAEAAPAPAPTEPTAEQGYAYAPWVSDAQQAQAGYEAQLALTAQQAQNQAALEAQQNLLNQMMEPGAATKTTTIQNAPSPELEAAMQSYLDTMNQVGAGMEQAYGGKQGTYDDLVKAQQDAYRTQGSAMSQGATAGALGAGLTPLEAQQLSQQAWLQSQQQMWPQVAGLRADQAQVAIDYQNALNELNQQYESMMADVMAPYYKGVAGTTTTETDELAQQQAIADLTQAMNEQALLQAQLQQGGQLAAMGQTQDIYQMQQDWEQAQLQAETQRYGIDVGAGTAQSQIVAQQQMNQQQIAAQQAQQQAQIEADQQALEAKIAAGQEEQAAQNQNALDQIYVDHYLDYYFWNQMPTEPEAQIAPDELGDILGGQFY